MNPLTKTTLQWASPVSLGLALALIAAALFGWLALRRLAGAPIGPARRRYLLAVRVAILAILAAILLNPVRVEETPGDVERPRVAYLLDSSQSMALGEAGATRWERAVGAIRAAEKKRRPQAGPQVNVFRFGGRLEAVEGAFPHQPGSNGPPSADPLPAPTDPDTLLTGALETLTGRFGQAPPQAVVVFSDGRARDPERAEAIARGYKSMQVPIHVLPVGDEGVGGDVAIVSMVAPELVRKFARVPVQVFLRSYGYKGRRAELRLAEAGPDGKPGAILARTPVVLRDGLAGYALTFEAGEDDRKIVAAVDVQKGEVSDDNNAFAADVAIDHTKIRVLYLEGSTEQYVVRRGLLGLGRSEVRGAYATLQQALMEDPDLECTAVLPSATGDFSALVRHDERGRGLPTTPSELFAYDAIILSNVPRDALSDRHLAWIDEWIARRGGGLCMVGGPNSFGSGGWAETTVAKMLPVEIAAGGPDWLETLTSLQPSEAGALHPIWQLASAEAQNRALLKTLPNFLGHARLGPLKPSAEAAATIGSGPSTGAPAIAVQPYGRGRTMAMATGITRRWANDFAESWGIAGDARYYKKFWRNAVYWLTENSSIGRRRLLAETDKRLYRPGEPIVIRARAFDENAALTLAYRVAVSIEPGSASDAVADDSPLRRPSTGPAPEAGGGPFLPWGEEFDLTGNADDSTYAATLPIAEARALPAGVAMASGLRIELTAYENNTQVDSTALDVRILDDPTEQQNPIPDHDLLARIAAASGGAVLRDPADLASVLDRLPVRTGPPEIKAMPAWSRPWLLAALVGLLTVDWVLRRRLGLA